MKHEHILEILDEKALNDFGEAELAFIKAHAAQCVECFQAFEAARISAVLLKTHAAAAASVEPSPFFQTRVMANLREKQAKINPFAAIGRLWKASASLVVLMMTMVVALIALTIFAPKLNTVSGAQVSSFDNYSTDMVIMNERLPGREPTNEQVFQIIYSSDNVSRK
ncbi:MAG TPA: hypothetical protein VF599_06885 [Pyrinomonadaceae bacterium]|jgi:hypothetical protein